MRDRLVEQREGIAHGAFGGAGDHRQRVSLDADMLGLADAVEMFGELRRLDAAIAKKDYSDASLALARAAAARFPGMAKARFLYGSLLLVKGRPAEAAGELEWVVAHDPSRAWAHVNLGGAYQALGRRADAVREFQAALALDPQNLAARERLKALGIP